MAKQQGFGSELLQVKAVAIALIAYYLLGFLIYNILQDFNTLAISAIIMCGTAYYLSGRLPHHTYSNLFVIGAVSYIAYDIVVLFFKITQESPVISQEAISALIFGGMTAGAYWLLRKYIET